MVAEQEVMMYRARVRILAPVEMDLIEADRELHKVYAYFLHVYAADLFCDNPLTGEYCLEDHPTQEWWFAANTSEMITNLILTHLPDWTIISEEA